jgi:hypothetical protein
MNMLILISAAVGTTLPCVAIWLGDARRRSAHRA